MKKVISLCLVLCMLATLCTGLTITASATDADQKSNPLCFTSTGNSTITAINNESFDCTLKYSYDKINWDNYVFGTTTINLSDGQSVYFNGKYNEAPRSGGIMPTNRHLQFSMTGSINVSGNIMSLVTETDFASITAIPYDYCFWELFKGCTALKDASKLLLPATTLANSCYYDMFNGCTGLTVAPVLPATTLADSCYVFMFNGCTSLTTAPNLPATTLTICCYEYMFQGCISLITAPNLPATTYITDTMSLHYYYMFDGCTSLVNYPLVPNSAPSKFDTSFGGNCYCMFKNCTNPPTLDSTYPYIFTPTNFNVSIGTGENCNIELEKTASTQYTQVIVTVTPDAGYEVSSVYYVADGDNTQVKLGKFADNKYQLIVPENNVTVYAKAGDGSGNTEDEVVEEVESEPVEADIIVGGKGKTVSYGNKTVVILKNDIGDGNIDLTSANVEINNVILKSDAVKSVDNITIKNRNIWAVINKIAKVNNSINVTLTEGNATYNQKKAMNGEVIAQVTYACTSNGKTVDTDAVIYVKCDSETAKVYYVIDENTIGEWKCEVNDGVCSFPRYKDGTYVIVK